MRCADSPLRLHAVRIRCALGAQAPLRNPPVVRARAQRLSWLRILRLTHDH